MLVALPHLVRVFLPPLPPLPPFLPPSLPPFLPPHLQIECHKGCPCLHSLAEAEEAVEGQALSNLQGLAVGRGQGGRVDVLQGGKEDGLSARMHELSII